MKNNISFDEVMKNDRLDKFMEDKEQEDEDEKEDGYDE